VFYDKYGQKDLTGNIYTHEGSGTYKDGVKVK